MSCTPLNQISAMAACMWSDFEGELCPRENLLSTFSNSMPRRHIPYVVRPDEEDGEVLSFCGMSTGTACSSDCDSDNESDVESDTESGFVFCGTESMMLVDAVSSSSHKRQLATDNCVVEFSSIETPNKKQKTIKVGYEFTAEDDALILLRVSQAAEKRSALWKELSEKYKCSINHITRHFDNKLKPSLAPAKAHLSADDADHYIKNTVKRWDSEKREHRWPSLAARLGRTSEEVQRRWEELSAVEAATRVQRKKYVRKVVPAHDPVYSHLVNTDTTTATNLLVDSATASSKPPGATEPAPAWYTSLVESQSQPSQTEALHNDMAASSSPVQTSAEASTSMTLEIPNQSIYSSPPSTPVYTPAESSAGPRDTAYWRTTATSRERHAFMIVTLTGNASTEDFQRVADLFGWSLEQVRTGWRQLNANRGTSSGSTPTKSKYGHSGSLAPAQQKAPIATRRKLTKLRTPQRAPGATSPKLSVADKDAILIRVVRGAISSASPVDWKYLEDVLGSSVYALRCYYNTMDVDKCIEDLIHLRVCEHRAVPSAALWQAINQELGLADAESKWKEIAKRANVCMGCGVSVCECGSFVVENESDVALLTISEVKAGRANSSGGTSATPTQVPSLTANETLDASPVVVSLSPVLLGPVVIDLTDD